MAKGTEEQDGERYYFLKDGRKVPSVTTIIGSGLGWNKQVLMGWAYKQGKLGLPFRDAQKTAMQIGTLAHKMAECHIKGEDHPLTPEGADEATIEMYEKANVAFAQFLEWQKMTRLKIIESEVRVTYEEDGIGFGGTIDAIAEDDDRLLHVMDFKVSNAAYAEYIIQISAYLQAFAQQRGLSFEDFKGIHILRFGKDAETFAHHYINSDRVGPAWEAFVALHKLFTVKKVVEKMV
jgi:hypothetical protein